MLQVGINAGGDGECTGSITEKTNFKADADGKLTIDWLLRVAKCGSTPDTLIMSYKLADGTWKESSRYDVSDFSGYAYGTWKFWDLVGYWEWLLESTKGNGKAYFSIGTPCVPAWVCETPRNGYEKDGCGKRRLNSACDPCVWVCETPLNGYETDGCGKRRLTFDCLPAGCVVKWKCETPLNGYETDGCGKRRLNSACDPASTKKYTCQDGICKESATGTSIVKCQETCGKDDGDITVIILIAVIIAAYMVLKR